MDIKTVIDLWKGNMKSTKTQSVHPEKTQK